jgi:hypothetical protein
MLRSLQVWEKTGLPPFEVPKRMRLMLSLNKDEIDMAADSAQGASQ